MDVFVRDHSSQLEALQIPPALFPGLLQQLRTTFGDKENGHVVASTTLFANLRWTEACTLLVLPHICHWNVLQQANDGLWRALESVPLDTLRQVHEGLEEAQVRQPLSKSYATKAEGPTERLQLLNAICLHPQTWPRICLYRQGNEVYAALPSPPYFPIANNNVQDQNTATQAENEADLTGPFPFFYHQRITNSSAESVTIIPTFLVHWGRPPLKESALPTMDLVPAYTCPNELVRAIRHVTLFGAEAAPRACWRQIQTIQAQFVQQMHLVRQQRLEQQQEQIQLTQATPHGEQSTSGILKVYTDANDPLGLAHAESGLDPSSYQLVNNPHEADILFSFTSLFAPQCTIYDKDDANSQQLINQFPYEGAWVQKDHLARGILQQHGLPLPNWALESFDLDVHLAQFVATAAQQLQQQQQPISSAEQDSLQPPPPPLWIVKPAHGTQSRGHVVTHSLAHVQKLLDAGAVARVAQRYISNPVTLQGRKVDCRCLVVLRPPPAPESTSPWPLFLHKRVYFRIAHRKHSVLQPQDWINPHIFLTATHLFANDTLTDEHETAKEDATTTASAGQDNIEVLPVDYKTIAMLEAEHPDQFDWNGRIWPTIQTLVCELFGGMTIAYADKLRGATRSRAVYGVDIMFEKIDTKGDDGGMNGTYIEPKLTEVTFCPANNAICSAYERDEDLYRSYNTELFDCMFRETVSDSWLALSSS